MSDKKTKRVADFEPAPFPKTDSSEVRAIDTFKILVNPDLVKVHVRERDKIPNYDGQLELVDRNRKPLGQLEVQVKHLDEKDWKRRGFNCGLEFLAYVQKAASLPVLLIGVAPGKKEVFWVELQPEALARIEVPEDQQSITIQFPESNTIREGNEAYYSVWLEISKKHSERIRLYDSLNAEVKRLEDVREILNGVGTGIVDNQGISYEPIQEFLDEINHKLREDLSTVKSVLFPNGWMLGFAFSQFEERHTSYCLFEILRGRVDLPIKRLLDAKTIDRVVAQGQVWRSHRADNPIANNPKRAAWKYLRHLIGEVLDATAIRVEHDVLSREIIFSVVEKIRFALGLEKKESYSIEELSFAFRVHLPMWLYAIWVSLPSGSESILSGLAGEKGYLDIGKLTSSLSLLGVSPEKIRTIITDNLKSGGRSGIPMPIGLEGVSLRQFDEQLTRLGLMGVTKIQRPYKELRPEQPVGPLGVFTRFAKEELFSNLKAYYENLPSAYDNIVQMNFPRLKSELSFYREFNRRYVFFDPDSYQIHDFDLRMIAGSSAPTTEVSMWNDTADKLFNAEDEKEIEIEGSRFEIISSGSSGISIDFSKTPLLSAVTSELQARFTKIG